MAPPLLHQHFVQLGDALQRCHVIGLDFFEPFFHGLRRVAYDGPIQTAEPIGIEVLLDVCRRRLLGSGSDLEVDFFALDHIVIFVVLFVDNIARQTVLRDAIRVDEFGDSSGVVAVLHDFGIHCISLPVS